MKVYKNEEEQRLMGEERAQEKEKTAKEAGRKKRGQGRRSPRRREVTNYRRTST